MTVSPYITEAIARTKLPIKVRYGMAKWMINYPSDAGLPAPKSVGADGSFYLRYYSPDEATAAYLRLCESLETAGSSSPAATAADCPALTSPGVR